MIMKLLSIIIPTYNMEALLPQCLDSLILANQASALDILVVNDGSKDNSLAVAQAYAQQFPDIITVIDKPNGNYGSTINAALPKAQGAYVKILDSDDKFDTNALDSFLATIINLLSDSNNQLPDMIVSPFTEIGAKTREVVRYNTMGREPYQYGKVYQLDEILPDGYIRSFLMHALTYRTELLRAINYRQTEGISYTDTEWASYPTFHARTICFVNYNLYQYNLDREGQTMSPQVLLKSVNQMQILTDAMISYYGAHASQLSPVRLNWMNRYFENRIRLLYKIYLLDMPRADFSADELKKIDDKYLPVCQRYGWTIKLYPENKLLRTEYISYWHKHHKRWPLWYERFNHFVDVVVRWLYIRLFRK